MSQYNQNQPGATNHVSAVPRTAPIHGPPPPDANAIKHGPPYPSYVPPPHDDDKTIFKGDGFWRGCCAGWCCYCCLDMCF